MSPVPVLGAVLRAGLQWWVASSGEEPLPPVDQDPQAVQDAACRIVERAEQVCAPEDTLPDFDPEPPDSGPSLDFLTALLWLLIVAALVAVVWFVVRALLERTGHHTRRRRGRRESTDDEVELDRVEREGVAIDRSREPLNWRAEAEAHRAAGRFRDALRCRYRALVGDLARRGLIDEIPGRTTGEERVQLRQVQPAASRPFEAAADLFDGAWYGHLPVSAADDDDFQRFERDVLATAGERR